MPAEVRGRGVWAYFGRHLLALLCAFVAILAVEAFTVSAASGDIYVPGTTGYDVSYPQCNLPVPNGSFVVLGVNNGRPFRNNQCLSRQYREAPKAALPSLYLNTGFDPSYDHWLDAGCASRSRGTQGSPEERHGWAIGCSEAASATTYADQSGMSGVSMWWLDVESGNSWSEKTDVNRATLQGAVDYLHARGTPVGIYSNADWWNEITGGAWNPVGIAANWVGTVRKRSVQSFCGIGFSSAPVWLVQYIEDSFDRDYACFSG